MPDAYHGLSGTQLLLLSLLSLPVLFILMYTSSSSSPTATARQTDESDYDSAADPDAQPKSIMQAENPDLAPPRNDPFTLDELKAYDGSDPNKPIYLSIKGTVFDVTKKKDMYGPGRSYNLFAGKDGSRGLGMSSLKEEDAVPDYITLSESYLKVLDDWYLYFLRRYNIVGRVVDLPEAVAQKNQAWIDEQIGVRTL